MKFTIPLHGERYNVVLNRCGYAAFTDPNTGKESFVRRYGKLFYPRFHLYVQQKDAESLHVSLHLDMKKTTYIKGHAHSGEYDGPLVVAEIERILALNQRSAKK